MAELPARSDGAPSGDRASRAFTDLYTAHYGHVLAYAQRRTDQDSNARDVAAETFLIAWRRLDVALAGGLPWLYTTAGFVLANHHRTQRRASAVALRLAVGSGAAVGGPGTEGVPSNRLAHVDPAAAHADHDELRRAVRQLPARDRELLLLTVWEHLDVATAARVIGCSTAAAHVRLHRARRKLRQLLTATDGEVSHPARQHPTTDSERPPSAAPPDSPARAALRREGDR